MMQVVARACHWQSGSTVVHATRLQDETQAPTRSDSMYREGAIHGMFAAHATAKIEGLAPADLRLLKAEVEAVDRMVERGRAARADPGLTRADLLC
jgi:hypothetical protein